MSDTGLSFRECVERAVTLLPEDDEPIASTGADEYALLVRRICAEKRSPDDDGTVKERHIAELVDQALSQARDADEEVFTAFEREYGLLIDSSDRSQFQILFPLKLRAGRGEDPPETIEANSTTLRKIETERWKDAVDAARNEETESAASETLPELLDDESSKNISARQNTFYICETEARDAAIAYSKLERDLDIILGKLNFAAVDWQLEEDSMDELRSVERTRPDAISRPIVYLIFKDGEYQTFERTSVSVSRTGFRLPRGFSADFSGIRRFPPQGTGHPADSEISRGFRALQAGLMAQTNESAFLYYWRGIEEITFHDRGESSKNALERSLPLVHDSFSVEILRSVFESLANKRNDIVHSGIALPVYVRDVVLLRQMLYYSLDELYGLRQDDYSKNEIIGVLDFGLHDPGKLEQKKESHENDRSEIKESLEELRGAQRWRNERASLEDVKKVTPLQD